MKKQNLIRLYHHQTKTIVFEGYFSSFRECVEMAINRKISLDHVDFSGQNLGCANLDDGSFRGANFFRCNLRGANLSECNVTDANFSHADLTSACLALSIIKGCQFYQTSFSVTDVTDAIIANCVFSCPTAFDLTFARAQRFYNCVFYVEGQGSFMMNEPPIVIGGLSRPVVIMDDMVKIGQDFFDREIIEGFDRGRLVADHGEKMGVLLYGLLSQKQNSFIGAV